ENINLGLDLQGGVHVVLEAVDTPDAPVKPDSIDKVKAVIENRVNGLGVKEPIIQKEGNRRLIVELAGVQDAESAIATIDKTAMLKFVTADGKVVVKGEDLKDAQAAVDPNSNAPYVSLKFDAEGARKFGEATTQIVKKYPNPEDPKRRIAIFLDEEMLTNPTVRNAITTGDAQITGGYKDLADANKTAILLRSGALPVKLEKVAIQTVGPTLGADSLAKSKKAGIAGIAAILVFMIAYYRLPGLMANIALTAYMIIVLGILAALHATLTLPGIAGFLLSIGMAVDANVIIFERLKEEIREGNSIRKALESGFSRAFWTIFDSNVTTLIAAAVLYYFGTGAIRGFALTLSIGILTSMFTAITLSRWLLKLVIDSGVKNKALYGA
ncbi:MAG TPA: protein translocase subunit SecD, partial [Desulfobacteria bacterium]|nr:protein translocase subunit SecD [Desulfobacteria bacterium]